MLLSYLGIFLCVVEVCQFEGYLLGLDCLPVSSVADESGKSNNDCCCKDEKD